MIAICVLAACGFRAGALDSADAADAEIDAPDAMIDGAPADCTARWIAGPTFSSPVPVAAIDSSGTEGDPYVTSDELAIYFVLDDNIYVATRAAKTDSFGTPAIVTSLSTGMETKVSLTRDGLTAFFNSWRPTSLGRDIWRATRAAPGADFAVDRSYLSSVDDAFDQWDPHISLDGLRLYYAPTDGTSQHLALATRTSPTSAFGTPAMITELESSSLENDPTLSGDERVIVFGSSRTGALGIFYATRATSTAPFDTPVELATLNSPGASSGPTLTADACHLYFVSSRSGGGDIFVVSVM